MTSKLDWEQRDGWTKKIAFYFKLLNLILVLLILPYSLVQSFVIIEWMNEWINNIDIDIEKKEKKNGLDIDMVFFYKYK